MDLGKRFKRYRERAGLTQSQAASYIGVKSYQLGNYETNRSEPNITTLKKMSEIYKVSVDELIGNFKFKDTNQKSEDDIKQEEINEITQEFDALLKRLKDSL